MWNASKTSIQNSTDNKLFKWKLEYEILDVWSLFLGYEEEGQQTRHGRKPIRRVLFSLMLALLIGQSSKTNLHNV